MKTKEDDTTIQAAALCSALSVLLVGVLLSPVSASTASVASVKLPAYTPSLQNQQIQHPYPHTANSGILNNNQGSSSYAASANAPYFQRERGSHTDTGNNLRNDGGNSILSSNILAARTHSRQQQDYYDPFYFYNPRSGSNALSAYAGLSSSSPRNRRNSLNSNTVSPNNYDLNDKYNILSSKSAYPFDNNYASASAYPIAYRHNNHNGHSPNQFLTEEQITRQGNNRNYYPSNSIDYYGPQRTFSTGGRRGGEPWSVQIGTQLKVNDDGRAPDSARYYVRDERNTQSRRYPFYRI